VPGELHGVPSAATRASINHIFEMTNDPPHANTARSHLTDRFEFDAIERVSNTLL